MELNISDITRWIFIKLPHLAQRKERKKRKAEECYILDQPTTTTLTGLDCNLATTDKIFLKF